MMNSIDTSKGILLKHIPEGLPKQKNDLIFCNTGCSLNGCRKKFTLLMHYPAKRGKDVVISYRSYRLECACGNSFSRKSEHSRSKASYIYNAMNYCMSSTYEKYIQEEKISLDRHK